VARDGLLLSRQQQLVSGLEDGQRDLRMLW
jgi:hypothetical protein